MKNVVSDNKLAYEANYILFANGLILFLALVQKWNFSDLFLFLFLQSVLLGIVALATLLLLNFKKFKIINGLLHTILFSLHYYFFTAILMFAVYYDSGYVSLQNLREGLTTFFVGFLNDSVTISTELNTTSIALTLMAFLLFEAYRYFQRYKAFNYTNRPYIEIHVSPYSKHLLVFFFVFLLSTAILQPIITVNDSSSTSELYNQAVLITFFVTLSVIEVGMKVLSRKLDLI